MGRPILDIHTTGYNATVGSTPVAEHPTALSPVLRRAPELPLTQCFSSHTDPTYDVLDIAVHLETVEETLRQAIQGTALTMVCTYHNHTYSFATTHTPNPNLLCRETGDRLLTEVGLGRAADVCDVMDV